MKKIVTILSSALPDDANGYEKVKGQSRAKLGKCPKWDFDLQKTFEGLFVGSREQTGSHGNYMVYEMLHKVTMKPYVFFGSTVLDENMMKVKELSLVIVEYKGKPKGKNYKVFEVAVHPTYKFAPEDWAEAGFDLINGSNSNFESEPEPATQAPVKNFVRGSTTVNAPVEQTKTSTPQVTKEFSDPPF